jgi:hypothetical protein
MKKPLTLAAVAFSAVACAATVAAPVASASTASKCATKPALEERLAQRRVVFGRADAKFLASEQSLSEITQAEPGTPRDMQALRTAEVDAAKAERAFHVVWQQNGKLEALDALCR